MTQGEDKVQILSEGHLPLEAASPTAADVTVSTIANHLLQHHKLRASLFDYQLKPDGIMKNINIIL
jgi:hypothetical protein